MQGSGVVGHLTEPIMRPLLLLPGKSSAAFLLLVFLLVGMLLSTRFQFNAITGYSAPKSTVPLEKPDNRLVIPLNCHALNLTRTCPTDYPSTSSQDPNRSSPPTCPEYFRWIHEDLRPWVRTGITRETMERAKATANFRLVILNGTAYLEMYEKSFQTRDVFTLWGILQLLRKYPGRVPDLEMMFDCVDWPVVKSVDYSGSSAISPPPLFRYCGNDETLDIVFPDWSYWGWVETNIKPWEKIVKDLKEGNQRSKWKEREPYAYWKGNPNVAETRLDLMKCNVSQEHDWNARLYTQDWVRESQQGYKQSDLANQCNHRYKIYIEGSAWSVSEKYILACDSVTLIVKPHYYDFFTRGLMPNHHYWPIKEDDKCKSIKFAVDWGNSHKQKAQAIGKAASDFIQEDLKMDYVYDYMFHLLNEYARLLTFKPTIPQNATKLCAETMACPADGLAKKLMMDSMVEGPADTSPCTMPSSYDPSSLYNVTREKVNAIKQIELWENKHWENQSKQS
ncbi:protein O-glucosyltransferase 2 [Ricinus communis]|uniref:KDEL motif-containing protein 1, putative n=1 Tax=Ricinus communis TaxID=3988 RepID=B9R9B2_RICCO|nr:protein O-glucosyltransferase 2 [Ricinus communis]XP_048229170.1 protein O-glucosyltransferase 2 [Ricinus communis]EEF51389.1 KDEL motif-containing protein 1 precursor, putative [Ricinus communis]|eukprot:XP_002510787.3 KDEL motif-containing protein 1 [Ricinus communis]